MSAPALPGGRRAPRRRARPLSGRYDTALGWTPAPGTGTAVRAALCLLCLAVFTLPFLLVAAGAFDTHTDAVRLSPWPQQFTLENFRVAGERGVWHYLGNSLVVVGGGLLLQIVVSVLAAYALSRRSLRGRSVIMMVFLATMMLPEEVIAVPLALVLGDLPLLHTSVRGSTLGIILPVGIWGFSVFVMAEFMSGVPREIEEAARLDGVGELGMLHRIVLPLSRPALGVVTIFGFQMIWDQYLLPLIAATDPDSYTLPIALSGLRSDPDVGNGVLLAGALVATVPSLVVYLLLQSSMVRGLTSGALKG